MRNSKLQAIAIAVVMVLIVGGIMTVYYCIGNNEPAKADSAVSIGSTEDDADADEVTVTSDASDDAKTALEEEFEEKKASIISLEDDAIIEYLKEYGIPYDFDDNGRPIVLADRTIGTIYYANDEARTNSAKEIGLSKHPISSATEFVFDDFTKADVKKILEAEKTGGKIDFDKKKIKDLKRQLVETLVSNVVLGTGYAEMESGLYYGKSKTVYELSSAVRFIVDETKGALKDGTGMNRWVTSKEDPADKEKRVWYTNADYLANIIPIVDQIIEGAEVSAEVVYAPYNWGLDRSDSCQLRHLELASKPDTKAALVFRHYFKTGGLMEITATNLRDRRPELPSTPKAKKKAVKPGDPEPDPAPGYDPKPDRHPKDLGDPEADLTSVRRPTATPVPTTTPVPTATPYVPYPTATPIPTKNPNAAPDYRPNDDPGPGEPEPTPRVSKSPSDEVEESQHQPIADPQTGGTSQPPGSLSGDPTAHISPGGQVVTDPHGDDWRIENDQAETPPIGDNGRAPDRPDDNNNGGNNGSMAPPD